MISSLFSKGKIVIDGKKHIYANTIVYAIKQVAIVDL